MLNPVAIGIDALTGGILGGVINRVFTGVYNPSPQLVSQYNNAQMMARQTINAKQQIARSKDDLAKGGSGLESLLEINYSIRQKILNLKMQLMKYIDQVEV